MKRIFIPLVGLAALLATAHASDSLHDGRVAQQPEASMLMAATAEEATDSLSIELTDPETLSAQLTVEQLATTKRLRLAGSINRKDLSFVKTKMTALEVLDIRQAKILADPKLPNDYPQDCLPSEAFRDKKTLRAIYLPETLRKIHQRAFQKTGIKSIVIPDAVDSVGMYLFSFCPEIESVKLGTGLKKMGMYMFNACPKLSRVMFAEGLEVISDYGFAGCAITEITLPTTLKEIRPAAFDKNLFTEIVIPAGVVAVGTSAFRGVALTKVTAEPLVAPEATQLDLFDASVYEAATLFVPKAAEDSYKDHTTWSQFKHIELIKGEDPDPIDPDGYLNMTVAQPGGLAAMMTAAQSEETTKLRLKGRINYADMKVLRAMPNLQELDWQDVEIEEVTLDKKGEMVTYPAGFIPDMTFADRVKLEKVILPTTLDSIGNAAFSNTGLKEIVIPANVQVLMYQVFFSCESLTKAVYEEGSLLKNTGRSNFSQCKKLATVVLSPSIKTIEAKTFYGCTSLTAIEIPEGVEAIGRSAFFETGLVDITLPASLKAVVKEAFAGVKSLTKVTALSLQAPELEIESFDASAYKAVKLYVHKDAWESYADHTVWSMFDLANVYFIEGGQPQTASFVTAPSTFRFVPAGLEVLEPIGRLSIHTMDGRCMLALSDLPSGHFVALPSGFYILSIDGKHYPLGLR